MIDNLISCNPQTTVAEYIIREDSLFVSNGVFAEAGYLEVFAQTAAARIGWLNKDHIRIGTIGGVSGMTVSGQAKAGQSVFCTISVLSDIEGALVLDGEITDSGGHTLATCRSLKVFIQG